MPNDNELDEGFDDLDEEDEDDDPLIRKLRHRNRTLSKEAKAGKQAQQRLAEIERERTIQSAGLGELGDRKMAALLAAHGDGEFDPETLKQTAIELGFIAPPEPEVPDEELDALDRVEQASTAAQPQTGAGTISPTDAAGWSQGKWARFAKQYPEEKEALLRGETVRGVRF